MTTQSTSRDVRAYLLDPATAALRAITLPRERSAHLGALYRWIGAHHVDAVSLGDELTAFVDDEGLLVPQPAVWGLVSRPGVVYAGPAVILGHDKHGEPADPPAPIADVAALLLAFAPVIHTELVTITAASFRDLGAPVSATRAGLFRITLERRPVTVLDRPASLSP
jgi:hypothetical protein